MNQRKADARQLASAAAHFGVANIYAQKPEDGPRLGSDQRGTGREDESLARALRSAQRSTRDELADARGSADALWANPKGQLFPWEKARG